MNDEFRMMNNNFSCVSCLWRFKIFFVCSVVEKDLDLGFKVFKLDSTNIRAATKIKEELTTKDTKNTKQEEDDLVAEGDKENFRDFRAFRGSNLPDLGFEDDVVKTNAVAILKQAGIVDVRSL